MAGMTNLGKQRILEWAFGRVAEPTSVYLHLITDATAPAADDADVSTLTQASNMGTAVTINTDNTDFDASSKDDGTDKGYIQIKDAVFTASGGDCTSRYTVMVDNATWGSISELYAYWDHGSNKTISDTQTLTLQNLELDITEA